MSPALGPYEVLVRPVITERSSAMQAEHNQYTFEVARGATKGQIRAAVERLFAVRVTQVRTMNYAGKKRRVGRHRGRRAHWKKAIVTLAEGDTIDVFGGV